MQSLSPGISKLRGYWKTGSTVAVFEVDVSLTGNIILCIVEPEIVGSFKSLLHEKNVKVSCTRLGMTLGKQSVRVIAVDKKMRPKTLNKICECQGVKEVLCVAL